jgi:ferredoxin
MKMTVDRDLCSGHGRCYALAPDLFESDDEGFNSFRGKTVDVASDQEEIARRGANACPERAISLDE